MYFIYKTHYAQSTSWFMQYFPDYSTPVAVLGQKIWEHGSMASKCPMGWALNDWERVDGVLRKGQLLSTRGPLACCKLPHRTEFPHRTPLGELTALPRPRSWWEALASRYSLPPDPETPPLSRPFGAQSAEGICSEPDRKRILGVFTAQKTHLLTCTKLNNVNQIFIKRQLPQVKSETLAYEWL